MQIIYAHEDAPSTIESSIFLVGPTPRKASVESWRPAALQLLREAGYEGVVFVPEMRAGRPFEYYDNQIEWELKHLEMADVILAYVPRKVPDMMGLTTNVEFGRYMGSGKVVYGRPESAEHCRYLDWMYENHTGGRPSSSLEETVQAALQKVGTTWTRTGGEREVPLHIYRTPMFQAWLKSQTSAGNRLDGARVLWQFVIPRVNYLLSFILQVKIWVAAEERYKENEFAFFRSDISVIVPFCRSATGNLLETRIVLIKEFRSTVRNAEGFVVELPGGSSFKPDEEPKVVAAAELKSETGLDIGPDRFFPVKSRQLTATLATHQSHLFAVELTSDEIKLVEATEQQQTSFGVVEETEQTSVRVRSLAQILDSDIVDWSTIGMITNALAAAGL